MTGLAMRIDAAESLLKRYRTEPDKILKEECISVISNHTTSNWQKKAARILLNAMFGANEVNDMIESFAIVNDRNDALVRRWKLEVIARDGHCVHCGSTESLQAHHISHWADDPINRINVDNGLTLCSGCHSNEHPELSEGLFH